TGSQAFGINNKGHVVGYSGLAPDAAGNVDTHGFIYDAQEMHDIGTLGASGSYAWAINDADEVVGESDSPNGVRAFLYNGSMHDLGTLRGGTSIARAINRTGKIVGSSTALNEDPHAFLYSKGAMLD